MTNFLTSMAPPSGRALFSARPAAPLPNEAPNEAPNEVSDAPRFDEALRSAQLAVLDPVSVGDAAAPAAAREASSESDVAEDQSDDHLASPALSLIPGTTPTAVAGVPAAIVAVPGGVPAAGAGGRIIAAAGSAVIPAAPAATGAGAPKEITISIGPDAAAPRAAANAELLTAAATDRLASPVAVASATANVHASALRGVAQEASIGGEGALALLASEHSRSIPAMPVIVSEADGVKSEIGPGAAARQPLATLLAERLHVQINQRSEHAVIRLDPPSMGSIEIVVRQEAGGLQIQLRASNGEVARQLQAIGDTLRQDLVQRQHGDVSVQVWDGSRDADGRQRQRPATPWRDDPGRALSEAGEQEAAAFALNAE